MDQRFRALDLVRKYEPEAAWKLMLGILPKGHDSVSPSAQPRWRDFTAEKTESVTWPLIHRGADDISRRLLEDAQLDAERWTDLLERLGDLTPDSIDALDALDVAETLIKDEPDRALVWDNLRRLLHDNRQFLDAEWALPEKILDRLEDIYERFAPIDPLKKIAWLFEHSVALPSPSSRGWESEQRDLATARSEAALKLFNDAGAAGILALARLVKCPGFIGGALAKAGVSVSELDALLETAIRSDHEGERDLAHGLIHATFPTRKEAWAQSFITKARTQNWGEAALMTIMRALPQKRWTWDQVSESGTEFEASYWRKAPIYWMSDDGDEISFAIRKLIDVGRARAALSLANSPDQIYLPSSLLVELLQQAASQPFEDSLDRNEPVMFQHYVAEILQELDGRDDIDHQDLIRLEWNYLLLLEHSHRPAKVLLRALSEEPAFFIEVLSLIYKSKDEENEERDATEFERVQAVATQAFRLLEQWDHIPGAQDNGTIDAEALETWIRQTRSLAKDCGREDIADLKIGNMLASSPVDADGNWPAVPVREALDLFRSKSMLSGFRSGTYNRRGVTSRLVDEGGQLERDEASKYRAWAKELGFDYPHTAKALDMIAESYEDDAKRHDQDAERSDWES